MKYLLIIIVGTFISGNVCSQVTDYIKSDLTTLAVRFGWDISKLNTAGEVKYMTRQE